MKKSNRITVSKNAWNIAKNYTHGASQAEETPGDVLVSLARQNTLEDSLYMQRIEDEVMGEVSESDSNKSMVLERNLNQMVDVLHLRLRALETAARVRLEFCAEDLMANSKKESKMAPKIMEEFEDQHVNPKVLLKDVKTNVPMAKDVNLVSTEGVSMDPVRLVLKTKQATESAKKLETKLEDKYSSSRLEMKGKKSKTTRVAHRTKESQTKRYEIKKSLRQKHEKELTQNMEGYVTRSVNEPELDFIVPSNPQEEIRWPISIKWPNRESKVSNMEGSEGEMNPELLLLYSLERINLPSGEGIFQWFFKYTAVQQYFVYMFWFIKVLFFQSENEAGAEKFLLRKVGKEYVKIVELLSRRAHGENNKDFVFKYFPYILANAVYYGFYFLCPGSRHLYSKGLRKTILLQIVQVMHGVQLCPVSVRVAWAKLFPEEVQDDDEAEDNEMIPLAVPVHGKKAAGPNGTTSEPASPFASSATRSASGLHSQKSHRGGFIVPDDNSEDLDALSDAPPPVQAPKMTADHRAASHQSTGASAPPDPDTFYNFQTLVDPLQRVSLRPPPPKSRFLVPRQRRERADVNDISPQMQQYLELPTACGGKRSQTLSRTVPINWCVTGGSDTHRRRQIPKELHDELSNKSKTMQKIIRKNNARLQMKKVRDVRLIDKSYNSVLNGGNGVVSRYSQDLVRKLKHARGLADCETKEETSLQKVQTLNEEEEFSSEFINSVLGAI
mmetsp:Transcript_12494/g.18872  ORF Transcript_12494/g.18872 Transcript_12494/m.18872 type:complete len:727 (+) Transcript_12494:158-2338(+)|eukprot:CAMPEP_0185036692 /NCGR_PEP_ID=MMETSP1103-20130426/30004_1 /TAXON_ID=36769 /ORGANISM="Paraphysomonas bandaiensis, Strain Caron Lab Isolate" /LENGTH=726 /DNA_ID=CAMNT_0027574317 /DNA_START=83 /DNA_END=2263 /DNA_ORIENTATION=-